MPDEKINNRIYYGYVLASATVVSASGSLTVDDSSNVKFMFNGKQASLPNGYTVLSYQDHTYVPARFVTEQLGANVGWDDNSQSVLITSPTNNSVQLQQQVSQLQNTNQQLQQQIINLQNQITQLQQNQSTSSQAPQGAVKVSSFPYTYKSPNGMQITFNKITADSSGTVINITLTNTGKVDGDSMMSTSQIMVGGTKVDYIAQDQIFYDGFLAFHPQQSATGNVTFSALPSGTKQLTLYYSLQEAVNFDKQTITFDLSN